MPRQTRNSLTGRGNPAPEPTTSLVLARTEFPATVTSPVSSVHSTTQVGATDEAPGDNVCHICTEEYNTGPEPEAPVTLACGHRFGLGCLHRWTQVPERNHACPLCNRHLYPAAVRQRQLLAHAPSPHESIEEGWQNLHERWQNLHERWQDLHEVLIVRNPVTDEVLPRRSPLWETVGIWCYAILVCLVVALQLYAWWRLLCLRGSFLAMLVIVSRMVLGRFCKRIRFIGWFNVCFFGLLILAWLV